MRDQRPRWRPFTLKFEVVTEIQRILDCPTPSDTVSLQMPGFCEVTVKLVPVLGVMVATALAPLPQVVESNAVEKVWL